MLFHLLYPLSCYAGLGWLNVVRYPSARTISSALTAMLISLLLGPWLNRQLDDSRDRPIRQRMGRWRQLWRSPGLRSPQRRQD
jgi:hypothetical protein